MAILPDLEFKYPDMIGTAPRPLRKIIIRKFLFNLQWTSQYDFISIPKLICEGIVAEQRMELAAFLRYLYPRRYRLRYSRAKHQTADSVQDIQLQTKILLHEGTLAITLSSHNIQPNMQSIVSSFTMR